jgi:hypothetical protein
MRRSAVAVAALHSASNAALKLTRHAALGLGPLAQALSKGPLS